VTTGSLWQSCTELRPALLSRRDLDLNSPAFRVSFITVEDGAQRSLLPDEEERDVGSERGIGWMGYVLGNFGT
jgi:hypothetical protein